MTYTTPNFTDGSDTDPVCTFSGHLCPGKMWLEHFGCQRIVLRSVRCRHVTTCRVRPYAPIGLRLHGPCHHIVILWLCSHIRFRRSFILRSCTNPKPKVLISPLHWWYNFRYFEGIFLFRIWKACSTDWFFFMPISTAASLQTPRYSTKTSFSIPSSHVYSTFLSQLHSWRKMFNSRSSLPSVSRFSVPPSTVAVFIEVLVGSSVGCGVQGEAAPPCSIWHYNVEIGRQLDSNRFQRMCFDGD